MKRYKAPRTTYPRDSLAILALVGVVLIVLLHAYVINNSKDVLCSPNHEAYTVVLGKTWRTEDKDAQCKTPSK